MEPAISDSALRPHLTAETLSRTAVAVLILASLAGAWAAGSRSHYISCRVDCAGTFIAQHQARNIRLGSLYGFLENHATGGTPSARPDLYTGNANIGSLVFQLLELGGLHRFEVKQALTLLLFGLGLLYGYRAVAFHAGSEPLAAMFVALLATTYLHVFAFALNPLRVWHFVAFFGLLFHTGRLARSPESGSRRDSLAVLALAFASLGIGYDFHAVCFFLSAFLVLFSVRDKLLAERFRLACRLVVLFAVPVVTRQVQVAAVMGPEFWAKDLFYRAAAGIPLLRALLALPNTGELERFYRAAGALPSAGLLAAPDTDLTQSLPVVLREISIPSIGALSCLLATLAACWALWSTGREFLDAHLSRPAHTLLLCAIAGAALPAVVHAVARMAGFDAPVYLQVAFFLCLGALAVAWVLALRLTAAAAREEELAWTTDSARRLRARALLLIPFFLLLAISVAGHRRTVAPDGSTLWPALHWLFAGFLALAGSAGILAAAPGLQRLLCVVKPRLLPPGGASRGSGPMEFDSPVSDAGAKTRQSLKTTLAAIALAIAAGLALFTPTFVQKYLEQQAPLIIFPVILAKAAVVVWLCQTTVALCRPFRRSAVVAAAALLALLADHAIVQWANYRQQPSMDLSWLDFVKSHRNSTYAVSWIPSAVTGFTSSWTVGIKSGRETLIAKRIRRNQPPFEAHDVMFFGQRDGADEPGARLRPDYWIYFPTAHLDPTSSAEPVCRQDYLLRALDKITFSDLGRRVLRVLLVEPATVAPGDEIFVTVDLDAGSEPVDRIEALEPYPVPSSGKQPPPEEIEAKASGSPTVASLRHNCVDGRAEGRIPFPAEIALPDGPGPHHFIIPLQVRYKNGRRFVAGSAGVLVEPAAEKRAATRQPPEPQPSPNNLAAALPSLRPVSSNGRHVIFDLRALYAPWPPEGARGSVQ